MVYFKKDGISIYYYCLWTKPFPPSHKCNTFSLDRSATCYMDQYFWVFVTFLYFVPSSSTAKFLTAATVQLYSDGTKSGKTPEEKSTCIFYFTILLTTSFRNIWKAIWCNCHLSLYKDIILSSYCKAINLLVSRLNRFMSVSSLCDYSALEFPQYILQWNV